MGATAKSRRDSWGGHGIGCSDLSVEGKSQKETKITFCHSPVEIAERCLFLVQKIHYEAFADAAFLQTAFQDALFSIWLPLHLHSFAFSAVALSVAPFVVVLWYLSLNRHASLTWCLAVSPNTKKLGDITFTSLVKY